MSYKETGDGGTVAEHITNTEDDWKKGGAIKTANVHNVALSAAIEAQKPSLFSKNMLKLGSIMAVGYLVSTINGYDGSLMGKILPGNHFLSSLKLSFFFPQKGIVWLIFRFAGSLNAMDSYQKTFGLTGEGSATG